MAAKLTKLSELHEVMAEMMLEEIKACREAEIPMSASDKAVIIKFLKDNNVTADIDSSELDELRNEFEDDLAKRRAAKIEARNKAFSEDGTDPLQGII